MSDRLLWDALRKGQKAALEKIYSREVDYLYNYSKRITQDEDLIMDALQDLFIELWNRHDSLGSTDAIRPYLITSLRRKIIAMAKKSSLKQSELNEDLDFRSESGVEKEIIEEEEKITQKNLLANCMDQLSKRQREAVYLKFYQEASYDDICQIMDINYQSARNLVSSGLKKMKDFIDSG